MKLSTETKAGIMVACSFLGLTGVFVGKKFLDPDGNVEALVSEIKKEGDPAKDPSKNDSKSDAKGDPKADGKTDGKGTNSPKEKAGDIVQTKSQVELPGGIPPLPGTTIPSAIPAPVTPKETLPGGLPPLPGTEAPSAKPMPGSTSPMSGNVARSDGPPSIPPLLGDKTKSDPVGSLPPPPPPPVSEGLPGGIPPLPGETNPPANPSKPATADGAKEKPGAVTSLPKNDKTDLKSGAKAPDFPAGVPPLSPPPGLGGGSSSTPGGLGAAPPPPSGMPSLDASKDALKSAAPSAKGLGSSEFSPSPSTGFALPERRTPPNNLGAPPLGNGGLGGTTSSASGLGSSGLGSPGLGGRIASAAVIPPVAVTTFSPNTGPIKRTEFIPIEESPAAPAGNGTIPSGAPGPMATPPPPAPTGLPDLPPGGLSNNSGGTKSPGFGNPLGFVANTPPPDNRPFLRMSGEETKPSLQPAGLQYTPLNSQPAKANNPNAASAIGLAAPAAPSKVSSWSEKVYTSVSGDTWETISQTQYQRKDLGRMLQSYNEIHPRLVALPKTGALPPNSEIYLPPAEELIRQGASVVPIPAPISNVGAPPALGPNAGPPPAPGTFPSGNLPPPGPLPSGLGGRP